MVLSNAQATIHVNNAITFTNSDDLIWTGTNYTLRAQSSVADVDWEIDIYDCYNNFVNYQTGHSTDGIIEWTWDLTDTSGNSRADSDADPFFYPYITITASAEAVAVNRDGITPQAGSTSTGRWMPPVAAPYPNVGGWIIAYLDRYYLDVGTNSTVGNSFFQTAMNTLAGGPGLWGIPATKFPLKYGNTIYNQSDRDNSWVNLRAYLYDPSYRNFYYFGHGAANLIGADIHSFDSSNQVSGGITLPGSKAYLTSKYVRDNLTFNKNSGARPYRFVYLDGCNTANGDWPDAFGINKSDNDLSYYTSASNKRHVRPSAFVGWTVVVGGDKAIWGTVDKYFQFRSCWMSGWSVNTGNSQDQLNDVIDAACACSSWPPGGLNQLHDKMRIYGYRALKFNEYNRKGDWSQ